MIIEADNTTRQLMFELQESIRSTISGIQEDQGEIKSLVERIKNDILDDYPEELKSIKKSIDRGSNNINNQLSETSEAFNELKHLVDTSTKQLLDNVDKELHKTIDKETFNKGISNTVDKDTFDDLTKRVEILDKKIESVTKIIDTIIADSDSYQKSIDVFCDNLKKSINAIHEQNDNILNIENRNGRKINAIADYMSLPGYKRFFKGMEIEDEEN